jgi:hypothetical protein
LKKPEGKQTLEVRCAGYVFGAGGGEKWNVGQFQRPDRHALGRKGNVLSLQPIRSIATQRTAHMEAGGTSRLLLPRFESHISSGATDEYALKGDGWEKTVFSSNRSTTD